MATSLACYTENGCPELFPNGDEGQQIQMVGGVPTWIDPVVGAVSIVTDNLNGRYTHDDGNGNITVIDTNANTNPFNPAGINLTATTVQSAISQMAQYEEGWRRIGAVGANAAAAEPVRASDLSVSDDIQHLGQVLIGGAVGDVIDVNSSAETGIEIRDAGLTINSNAGRVMTYINRGALANEGRYTLSNRPETGPTFYTGNTRIAPVDDTNTVIKDGLTLTDRRGNAGLFPGVVGGFTTKFGAEKVWANSDGVGASAVVAPTAPWNTGFTHEWSKITAGIAERFVMDGGGNITQLSSHNDAIARILGLSGLGHSINSYNVFTGIGEGIDPISGKKVVYEIDTGEYEVVLADGKVEATGTEPELAYGQHTHAPLETMGYEGDRGPEMWDHAQKIASENFDQDNNLWSESAEVQSLESREMPERLKQQMDKAIELRTRQAE